MKELIKYFETVLMENEAAMLDVTALLEGKINDVASAYYRGKLEELENARSEFRRLLRKLKEIN